MFLEVILVSSREELIDKLCEIEPNVKFHYVNADCIQYCDDRSSPLLEVSQSKPIDSEGNVEWSFHFVESGDTYTFSENINKREA